ncbi:unnamed protein product [Coffea canephora]|uniref:O-fucosyltransferase family protein n=1 Tax=Coffea canephora TaxID=49390 RepID=A0A068VGN6_COFCA|nr:unnamed protein product [Coffea canephora]
MKLWMIRATTSVMLWNCLIHDMVAIARHLNVTLIVPELDKTSFWADPSEFQDILDVKVRLNNSFRPPIFQTHTHYNKIPDPTYLTHSVRAEYLVTNKTITLIKCS